MLKFIKNNNGKAEFAPRGVMPFLTTGGKSKGFLFRTGLHFLVISFLIMPLFVHAANTSLVFCNTGSPNANGDFAKRCGWKELVLLAEHLINYLILIAIPLAALSFAYAGFLILSSGGNSGKLDKGKEIFYKVAIGLAWVLVAWVVVSTILNALLAPGYSLLRSPSSG